MTSSYALDCNDIYGSWNGNLNQIKNVSLRIHPFDGMETANIAFLATDSSNMEFGLLAGDCKKNVDGSITMKLTRDSYGIRSAMDLQLKDEHHLIVSYFSYSDPWSGGAGSGELSK